MTLIDLYKKIDSRYKCELIKSKKRACIMASYEFCSQQCSRFRPNCCHARFRAASENRRTLSDPSWFILDQHYKSRPTAKSKNQDKAS